MDLEENVVENYDQKFARGSFWNDRMAQLTVSTWFFLGIDLVPLSCNEVNEVPDTNYFLSLLLLFLSFVSFLFFFCFSRRGISFVQRSMYLICLICVPGLFFFFFSSVRVY